MIKKLYSINDKLTGYLSPMIDIDDFTATRNFEFACKNNDMMNFRPSDYSLYSIGEFNSDSGELIANIPPKFIVSGSDFEKEI